MGFGVLWCKIRFFPLFLERKRLFVLPSEGSNVEFEIFCCCWYLICKVL